MKHLTTETDCPSNSLKGEAYLNSRREYWRKEAAKDRKNSEPKATVVKAKAPSVASSTNGLKGEAYLNSRREYWRKETAKDRNLAKKKVAEDSNVLLNKIGIVVGCVVFAFISYVIISGGGPLLFLFLSYAFLFIIKHSR